MKGKQRAGLLKRIVRFVFKGLWESTYRRKRDRTLYRQHRVGPPPREVRYIYYPRYHWMRRGKKGAEGKH
ncbi:MAG: hypothetical protein AMK69_23680 [Nitrospira bacterium SG8_3]|nr:MAG: hypothetical protein AMK69_23680 [Nitrospira bacterium SG8_3]